MTDGFDDRQPDDPPQGPSGEDGDGGARGERGGTGPNEDGAGPTVDGGGPEETGADADEEDFEPSLSGVFGARPEDEPPRKDLVPESPSLENALFLVLGVLLGGFVVYRAVTIFTA
jgi:hypothetical protein